MFCRVKNLFLHSIFLTFLECIIVNGGLFVLLGCFNTHEYSVLCAFSIYLYCGRYIGQWSMLTYDCRPVLWGDIIILLSILHESLL